MKAKALRQQDAGHLRDRLFELRGELSRLEAKAASGSIQKKSGNLRALKRDIARVLTVMREVGVKE